ncbi:alcohol dehydrogenase catalytic domain-containing protein [Nonomuraea turkmeniaca]|uniref:alcohol dehydrogenase catalytic domain-containing protein n=1 Tax=Nonomuraea turkmeniaca TaxID=103838 RepID=UPI001FE91758|nr:alcohol dehydrogenase catalytic domain-containing protein [Nonomuraea turkmeniaca]
MKAVVVHGPGDLRIEEVPDPSPGEGEVLLALEWGGICGSDIGYWRHGASGTAVLRHPLVLGHEVAGRIAGAGAAGLEPGRAVTVHPVVAAGELPSRSPSPCTRCAAPATYAARTCSSTEPGRSGRWSSRRRNTAGPGP